MHAAKIKQQKSEINKEKQQDKNKDSEGKDNVTKTNDKRKNIENCTPEISPYRKNNPCKQKREAAKWRQCIQQNSEEEQAQGKGEKP